MAWTYRPEEISTNDLMAVRLLVGDTDYNRPLLQDEEIQFFIDNASSNYFASADVAEAISSRYSGTTSKTVGPLTIDVSGIADQYFAKAKQLRVQARKRGGMNIIAGGLSYDEKLDSAENEDLITTAVKVDGMTNPGARFGNMAEVRYGL